MAKKKEKGKNLFDYFFSWLFSLLWFIIKIPYYIVKGIISFSRWTGRKAAEAKIKSKRGAIKAVFEDFKVVETLEGDFSEFFDNLKEAESKIGIIIGARGSGKTAFGVKLLENIHAQTGKKCYAIGFNEEDFPSWISVVEDISRIKNDSVVLVDEGGILFSSRRSMSAANQLLSDLILVARHKNLTILFISQNSSNLEINILRQADFLALKPSSLLQKDFERKIIQKMYEDESAKFAKHKKVRGLAYIFADNFKGFISNPLPSFWGQNISKSFR